MTRSALLGNTFLVTVAVACIPIFLAACFTMRYPSVKYVSSVELGAPQGMVHCFRAEMTSKDEDFSQSSDEQALELDEVSVAAAGHVKGQLRVAIDSRHPQLIGRTETVRHVVRLRLYRPGFETIELTPQDQVEVVAWKQASDLAAEAKAVDDLLHTDSRRVFPSNEDKPPSVCIEHILPGSASEGHRKALLFAASEYERLAGLAKDEQQKHLLERSAQVRALATSSDAPKP